MTAKELDKGIYMKTILEYLSKHGEKMDSEIASDTGLSLATVKVMLAELSLKGDVISCNVTRFSEGKKIQGISSRISGSIPQPSPGRKPKVETTSEA